MSNPKAPRVSRTIGGPKIPIGLEPDGPPELPVARFRRVGAGDDVIGYMREVWDSLDATERAEWLSELDVMTDDELADELDFHVGDDVDGLLSGEVVHEGGGWYSVWVDGVKVTSDNVRGRDAADELLDDHLTGRLGPIDEG